jgi:preprotein translocase subunit SecD
LTLAGIAGFILSIGMAVDANILIFERMKEELRAGRTLHAAIDAGFARAWTSIRDSNFSTLITCAILFWFGANFGASIIQGFAFTLAIGVVVSLFTAILVSRTFLQLIVETGWVRKLGWYGLDEPKSGAP